MHHNKTASTYKRRVATKQKTPSMKCGSASANRFEEQTAVVSMLHGGQSKFIQ